MWTKEEIGLVIKNTRLTAGLTQAQVAKSLGRPQQTIANWEVGRSQPDANTLFELFKLLGADLNTSFGFFPGKKEKAPLYSSEAMKLAKDYDVLDQHGQELVRVVADKELERIQTEVSTKAAPPEESKVVRFRVPGYALPMSAGPGEEAGQEYPEDYTLVKAPPRGTSYIARVKGYSMEPTYQNGDLVFVNAYKEVPVGKVGVFLMNGKQYIKERGEGVLISHNPDQVTYHPLPFTEGIQCQGLVLGVCDESYLE